MNTKCCLKKEKVAAATTTKEIKRYNYKENEKT